MHCNTQIRARPNLLVNEYLCLPHLASYFKPNRRGMPLSYACLFTGFMGTRDIKLNPVCNFNTMNLAKLVTARPLDASFITDDCGDVISACRSTCGRRSEPIPYRATCG